MKSVTKLIELSESFLIKSSTLFILYKSYKSNKNFVFEKFNIVNINNLFKWKDEFNNIK